MAENHQHDSIATMAEAVVMLSREVVRLTLSIEACGLKSPQRLATHEDLQHVESRIMSKISEFAALQTAFNDRINVAVEGVAKDIETLKTLITTLQNSPGAITPEDQATLDQLTTVVSATAAKVEALDALNPPTPPVVG